MTEFLIELYVSKTDRGAIATLRERLSNAAAALTSEGSPIRLVRSFFVPEDETCFLLVEALTAETVHETARRAALACERISETAADPTHDRRYHT